MKRIYLEESRLEWLPWHKLGSKAYLTKPLEAPP